MFSRLERKRPRLHEREARTHGTKEQPGRLRSSHSYSSHFDSVLAASLAEFFTLLISFAWSKARAASGGI
jgi:hypothetical protein